MIKNELYYLLVVLQSHMECERNKLECNSWQCKHLLLVLLSLGLQNITRWNLWTRRISNFLSLFRGWFSLFVLHDDSFGCVISLVNPDKLRSKVKHLISQWDNDKLSIFCSIFDIMSHNWNVFDIWNRNIAHIPCTKMLRTKSSINLVHNIQGSRFVVMKSEYESKGR